MAIGEQRCCRSGGPAFYLCPRALAAMSFVFSLFPAFCLSGVLGLREGVGSRPDSRVPFCARQKGTFPLAWGETHIAKQCGWRPKSASATLSGETHCAPSSLRSNSRRKFEFLYGGTPVLQLACGVAQALRLELPLPQAGEGTSSRIEKDFSSTTADSCCHQRHIQKQEPNPPLTPIQ